jgi:hypothetical protein
MFSRSMILAALLAVFAGPVVAGELNVQGGSSTGGDQYTIRGPVGGLCRFSVTGAFNDVVTARFGPSGGGSTFASRSIRDLATMSDAQLAPLIRYSVERLPDGQTRVLLGVPSASSLFNGGSVTLSRGSAVIDSDPVIIR